MQRIQLVVLAALFFVFLSCSQVLAIDIYGFASYWDKEDADGTLGLGIGVSLPIFVDYLRLDGRAHYFEDSDVDQGGGSVTMNPFDLGLQVHFFPSNPVDLYLLGGVSYVYVDSPEWSDIESDLGAYIGAGLDVELGSSIFKLFGEALYRYTELDGALDNETDVSGFTINAGIKLHF